MKNARDRAWTRVNRNSVAQFNRSRVRVVWAEYRKLSSDRVIGLPYVKAQHQ